MEETILRENLIELLIGGEAHIPLKEALKGLKKGIRNVRPSKNLHSVWELLEHMRISQEDILRYMLDPSWKSPVWPEGYWPVYTNTLSEKEWSDSVSAFFKDLEEVIAFVRNPNIVLTAKIPHGNGHTYLREVLLVADHNAYHLGQIMRTRKIIGDLPNH